jgi:hypothetical protein
VLPPIAEVEGEAELIARRDRLGDLDGGVILDDLVVLEPIGITEPDPPPALKLELVQVRQVPPSEGRVDGLGQRPERVCRSDDEDPTGRGPQSRTEPRHEINSNLQPRPRHRRQTLRDRF